MSSGAKVLVGALGTALVIGSAGLARDRTGVGAGGTWPNEPPGFTLVNDYDFGDDVPATNQGDRLGRRWWQVWARTTGWWQVWYNTHGYGTRTSDPTAPLSAPYVFQFLYPIGMRDGTAPMTLEYDFSTPVTELYWGVWWKPSNPFQSDGSGVNKIVFIWTPTVSRNTTDLLFMDLSPNPWRIRGMNDLGAGGGPTAGQWLEPNATTTVITLGQWHRIEIYVKYSTGSLTNGIIKWWVDGELNGTYTNLKMVQDGGLTHVQFSPTYGGNQGDRKTENDYYWVDHVHLSRAP